MSGDAPAPDAAPAPSGALPPAAPEPSSLRLVSSLGLAGLLAGLLLVLVYLGTKPAIDQNRAEALQRAIVRVLWHERAPSAGAEGAGGADAAAAQRRIEARLLRAGRIAIPDSPPGPGTTEPVAYLGLDASGAPLGYAIPAVGKGFQDDIELLYGFDPIADRIIGFEVLAHRETPGLGDRIEKDAAFVGRFRSLAVLPRIEAVRAGDGGGDHEVECITGATISSKAVVRILNESLERWRPALREAGGPEGPMAAGEPNQERR